MKILEFKPPKPPPVDNEWARQYLELAVERIDSEGKKVVGLAVAICTDDSVVHTFFDASHDVLLLGAVSYLQSRIENSIL